MPRVDLSPGEQAWEKYIIIQNLIGKNPRKTAISQALQLLGEAIIKKHNLSERMPEKKWLLTLEPNKVHDLALTNIFEMTHAQVYSWEYAIEAIPDMQVGHDSWVDGVPGREAGYYPHASLCQLLGERFFKEIIINDMTHADARNLYQRISKVVTIEMNRYPDSTKKTQIRSAMQRLWTGIESEYGNQNQVTKQLYSINTMLDFQLNSESSVREVLNLSRIHLLSLFLGPMPALWGKTSSLANVEEKLSSMM